MIALLILASFALVVVLAIVLVALIVSRRAPEMPPPASLSGLSPDGNWWWDGEQWLPSGRSSIPPVNRPS
jgi:hypothetical protein